MAWIESHLELESHPKLMDLMHLMSWDMDTAIGKLHRFWWWCLKYALDGDLTKHPETRLAMAVGLPSADGERFVASMVISGFLDREPYFRVHDWWDYVGWFLRGKYKNAADKWHKVKNSYVCEEKNSLRDGVRDTLRGPLTTPLRDGVSQKEPTNQPNLPYQPTKRERFTRPTPEEVKEYAQSLSFLLDGNQFCDYYESKGWLVGTTPMKNWKAAVRTWKKRGGTSFGKTESAGPKVGHTGGFQQTKQSII